MTGQTAQIIPFPQRVPQERWLTVRELGEHLGMSDRWIAYRVKEGMPSQRFGRSRRFRLSEVENWLQIKARTA